MRVNPYDDVAAMVAFTLLCAILLLCMVLFSFPAHGQQRQFYDAAGRNAGRAITSSDGTTTHYDPAGRVSARSVTSGNQTTVYGADGRKVGTVQWSK
jgi:YD repeat-containing protein